MDKIKTLYRLNVNLKTALHIGKGSESSTGAAELLKDGSGDYFIPGTTISGLFFDRLLDLESNFKDENEELWRKIHEEDKKKTQASSLIFRSSYFSKSNKNLITKIRDRVRIDNERKVAKDGAKFSYWEIEPDTDINIKNVKFEINIEIDNLSKRNLSEGEYKILQNYVEQVFSSWQKEGFAIGAFSASGNGWCRLNSVEKFEVTKDSFDNYLDNDYQLCELDLNKIKIPKEIYNTYILKVNLGKKDNYGTDALLIAGGDSYISISDNDVDDVFINTGKRVFIPGSSIKGAFTFFMEKYGTKNGLFKKWQKFLGQFGNDDENRTMGAGNFLVEDLFLVDNNNIELLPIERHKEDEFTRAIYGSGKFNEERLFNATFKGKIRVRKTLAQDMDLIDKKKTKSRGIDKNSIIELIKFLEQGMNLNLISLGANSAYPKFELLEVKNDK